MSGKEMRPLSFSVGALLPSFSLVAAAGDRSVAVAPQDCHGNVCLSDQYCSLFDQSCKPCTNICDVDSHNYDVHICSRQCPVSFSDHNKFLPFKAELENMQSTLHLILVLLIIILTLIAIRYLVKCLCWLRHRRCVRQLVSRLFSKPYQSNVNGKELNATTIRNLNAINRDIERAPSQIYSVAGAAEGSVVTMATPVSTRYPAENSTTPTTVVTEIGYGGGYDNQGMVVTPVAEKPTMATTTATGVF